MKTNVLISSLLLLAMSLTSCEAIGGIFRAGMWMGVIVVIIVIAIILWLVRKAR